MAKVISKIFTSVAYFAGALGKVEIRPGDNVLPAATLDALNADPEGNPPGDRNFQAHVKAGHMVVADTSDAQVEEAAPKPAAVDLRARLPGESDKKYNARMAKLDDEAATTAANDKTFLETYDALDEADRKATYETLDDREKALVDAPRPAAE